MSNFTIPPGRFKRSEAASHPAGPPSTTATWRGLHERKEEEVEVHGDDLAAGEGGPRIEDFPARINLKCDPERAIELRDEHPGIKPGWHMNKKHWNTVMLDGTVPPALVRELVTHSYQLVVDALPRKVREGLAANR